MKCVEDNCNTECVKEERDYQFLESGLENVVLIDNEIHICPRCGAEYPALPANESVNKEIAKQMIISPRKFNWREIRFVIFCLLRMKEEKLAMYINVPVEDVVDWINRKKEIDTVSDVRLRLLVLDRLFKGDPEFYILIGELILVQKFNDLDFDDVIRVRAT